MSKIIPLLTFAAGGAAAYALLRNSGNSERLGEQVHGAAEKVRDAVSGNMNSNDKAYDKANMAIDKAQTAAERTSDRVGQAVD